jgi:peptide deformylase
VSDICYYGNPSLRQKCVEVTEFDSELEDFVESLVDMMYQYDGVGLAAPQIGDSRQIIAVDVSADSNKPIVLINPVITWESEEILNDSEGCLSIPGIRGNVDRPGSITIKGKTLGGEDIEFEKIEGLMARAFQHELDHLNGVMFVDRLSPVKKRLIASKLKKMARHNKVK